MKRFEVGIDIEEVSRFKNLVRNRRFLQRIFTPKEISYCRGKKNCSQHFAVRFAAKEAVWKALNETLSKRGASLSHRDIGVANSTSGKPQVVLPQPLRRIAGQMSLSLSHNKTTAVAVAVVTF